jgi:NADH dehydrogenase
MSRDNLDSMKVDNVASGQALGLQDLDIQAAAVSSIAPTYLGQQDPCTKLNALRAKGR